MKKVFISQPMRDRDALTILVERDNIIEKAKIALNDPNIEIVKSYLDAFPDIRKNVSLYYLGESIIKLSEADVAIFAPGYENARGCQIEYQCAVSYNIDRILMHSMDDWDYISTHCTSSDKI